MIKTIIGDLFDPTHNFEVILHGCNCFHMMGAGVAKQVSIKFPEAVMMDKATSFGNKNKLGTISCLSTPRNTEGYSPMIVNMYTQFEPGKNFDIKAFEECLKIVKRIFMTKRIGMPMVGAGIGGGDWLEIQKVINRVLVGMDITVVKLSY